MNKLLDIIAGCFIGLANIIPGVSGGTMAVIFKIYDRFINGISSLLRHPVLVMKDLAFIIIGIVFGVIVGVFGISYGYEKMPFATVMLFVGLIIGGLGPIFKAVKPTLRKPSSIFTAFIAFVLIVLLPMSQAVGQIQSGPLYYIALIFIGAITAVTMIAPGISGSMILLILGYYAHVLALAKDAIDYVLDFNLSGLKDLIGPILLLAIGFIIGAILFAKLVKYILKKHHALFYAAVFGLLIASPIAILYILNQSSPLLDTPLLEAAIGLIFMLGAAYLSYAIVKYSEN